MNKYVCVVLVCESFILIVIRALQHRYTRAEVCYRAALAITFSLQFAYEQPYFKSWLKKLFFIDFFYLKKYF